MSNLSEINSKIDKIYISNKDFKKITKWGQDNLTYDYENPEYPKEKKLTNRRMFFPLKTFIIDIDTGRSRIQALVELDSFNPVAGGRITTDKYWYTYKRDYVRQGYDFNGEGAPEEIVRITHAFITEVLIYICCADRITEYRPLIEHTREQGEYNPYEYSNRVCFLLNDIIKYAGTHKTRKSIQYQCEVWGVRGHLRHYTDGKVVFIEPYKKGRKRDVLEPKSKTYMLTTNSKGVITNER